MEYPGWRLRIIGPSELGYDKLLRGLAATLSAQRLSIGEPVYGDSKLDAMRTAEIFVLPSLNENFGITVAYASSLACSPLLATTWVTDVCERGMATHWEVLRRPNNPNSIDEFHIQQGQSI